MPFEFKTQLHRIENEAKGFRPRPVQLLIARNFVIAVGYRLIYV